MSISANQVLARMWLDQWCACMTATWLPLEAQRSALDRSTLYAEGASQSLRILRVHQPSMLLRTTRCALSSDGAQAPPRHRIALGLGLGLPTDLSNRRV